MLSVFCRAEKCSEYYIKKWDETCFSSSILPEYTNFQRKKKHRELDGSLDEIFGLLDDLPQEGPEKEKRLKELKEVITFCAKSHLKIENPQFEKEMFSSIMDVTDKFIAQAKEFDPSFKALDIMQAMRNVWIMNLLQMTAGKKAEYTPSIFAYSMLYPYTDNFLDDPDIPDGEKERFNTRLSQRLKGEDLKPSGGLEEKVFRLIAMIESQYPRDEFGDVYDSILCIQQGQIKSLTQQSDLSIEDKDILSISVQKGGSSVLADAYLVFGKLDDAMFEFAVGYGFMLQLIDDLQDVTVDYDNGHYTVFSALASKRKKLDVAANKLTAFVLGMDYEKAGNSPYSNEIRSMITDNCLLMIFEAVSKNKKHFSRKYLSFAQKHSKIGLKYLIKTSKKLKRKISLLESRNIL